MGAMRRVLWLWFQTVTLVGTGGWRESALSLLTPSPAPRPVLLCMC